MLLLDEPFSHLDRDLRLELAASIGALLRTRGTTTLLVTHDEEEAARFADRTVRFDDLSTA